MLAVLAATTPSPPSSKALVVTRGDARAGALALKLEAALRKAGADVVDVEARYPPPEVSGAEGEALTKEGREAYDNLDVDLAVEKLERAVKFYEENPATVKVEPLAEIFVVLGASKLQDKKKKAEAKKDFVRALQTWPQVAPDPKLFGSDVQKAFADARKELGGATGKLSVTSDPGGAQVTVQGQPLGQTPLDAPVDVPAGPTFVQLQRPGYAPFGAAVEVQPGQTAAVDAKLAGAPAWEKNLAKAQALIGPGPFGAEALPPEAKTVARDAGARYLVLADVGADVQLQVWDTQDGQRLREVSFGPTDDAGLEQAARQVQAWLTRPVVAEAPAGKPLALPPVLKKWWFWAAVGGVVVAGTVVGVAAGTAKPAPPAYSVLLEYP